MSIDLSRLALGLVMCLVALPGDVAARQPVRVVTPTSPQFAKVWDKKNFSHRLFDSLLRRHVKRGRVNYVALRKSSMPLLREYLYRVANTAPAALSGGRNARLAFWINAHNALVLRTVLERLPKDRTARGRLKLTGSRGLWRRYAYQVGHRWYTPAEILHKVIRRKYKDPRIHFAVVRPIRGGPWLWHRAYTARKLSKWLRIATRRFLRDPKRGFRLDRRTRTVFLSRLFKVFRKDFRTKPRASELLFVAKHIKSAADQAFIRKNLKQLTIKYLPLDRSLNQ